MTNWAVVVGVDKYWTPSACLSGAVRDALRMREWLLDANGGGVKPYNLNLLLSPNDLEEVPAGLKYLPATQEMLIKIIERVVQQSGGEGDRLFFHYSGHGLTAWINFSEEEALVPEDFTDQLTTRSLGLKSILEYFESTQFREQFFFIDACRNIPWEGDFRIGEMPWARRRAGAKPAVQQFVFYATSPGVKAAEVGLAGNEQGAFTQTLIAGLTGNGKAKVWDYMSGEYLVRVDRLFDYLVTEMEKKKIAIAGEQEADVFQVPRLGGERGAVSGSNPVLARFPADTISKESLNVLVDPFTLEAQAAVMVEREGTTIAKEGPIAQLPVTFRLPPKEYIVHASAVEFEPIEKRCSVELYDSQQITIKLIPKPPLHTSEQSRTASVEESDEQLIFRGRKKKPVPERTPADWRETLQFSLHNVEHLMRRFNHFLDHAQVFKLQTAIALAEQALSNNDQIKGKFATTALQNEFNNCGVATQLCVAELAMHNAPKAYREIAQAVGRLRTAYENDDQATIRETSILLDLIVSQIVIPRLQRDYSRSLGVLLTGQEERIWRPRADVESRGPHKSESVLIVASEDLLTPLEIASSAGALLKIGHGTVTCEGLESGFYRTRLVSPEGRVTEKLIEFPGGLKRIAVDSADLPPSRILREMMKRGIFSGQYDHTLGVEKATRPIANAQVSTLLLLAGSATLGREHKTQTLSHKELGVSPFQRPTKREWESGIQVLFGIESDVHGNADEYRLQISPQGGAVPDSLDRPDKFSTVKGLTEFARATRPGDYWLTVQLRDQKPIVFALKLLPRRLTMLIFHVNVKGESRVFQYLLPLSPHQAFDLGTLRRLELIQRFYLSGRLDHAYEFAKDLPDFMASEPLALCLTGHILLKLGRVEDASRIANQVIESFAELSDGHVLNAECQASMGREEATRNAYGMALERGVPIFQDGLVQLFFGAQNYQIAHPLMVLLANMLKNRVRGVIWSAWSPDLLKPEVFLAKNLHLVPKSDT